MHLSTMLSCETNDLVPKIRELFRYATIRTGDLGCMGTTNNGNIVSKILLQTDWNSSTGVISSTGGQTLILPVTVTSQLMCFRIAGGWTSLLALHARRN